LIINLFPLNSILHQFLQIDKIFDKVTIAIVYFYIYRSIRFKSLNIV